MRLIGLSLCSMGCFPPTNNIYTSPDKLYYVPPPEMKLLVDNRERDLIDSLTNMLSSDKTANCQLSVVTLSIGDIAIETDEGSPLILIERKSIADLLASIKDGRYTEQGHRLQYSGTHAPHNIVYLIEGNYHHLLPRDKKTIISAMTSVQFFKGFSVQRSMSVVDSATIILGMVDRIHQKLSDGMQFAFTNANVANTNDTTNTTNTTNTNDELLPPQQAQNPPKYCSVVKQVKKDNITPENIGEIMLCQIPGISPTVAIAIMSHPNINGSFQALLHTLAQDKALMTNKGGSKSLGTLGILRNIMVPTNGGKSRKISSAVIQQLFNLFLPEQIQQDQSMIGDHSENDPTPPPHSRCDQQYPVAKKSKINKTKEKKETDKPKKVPNIPECLV